MRVREGCRGGREQFTWNSLKDQEFKDRECYLGQSTKVGMMGKFGRYQLHDWYARKRDTAESISSERSAVQQYEEELMQEALGLKPKKLLLAKRQLTEEELKEFLKAEKSADKKGREAMGPQKKLVKNEYGEQVSTSNEDFVADAARDAPVKGLGFASHRDAKLEQIKAKILGTVDQMQGSKYCPIKVEDDDGKVEPMKPEAVKLEQVKEEAEDEEGRRQASAPLMQAKEEPEDEQRGSVKRHRSDEDSAERQRRKAQKKEKQLKKAEKKLRKQEKKTAKLEKKMAKRAERMASKAQGRRSVSSSSSSS